MDDHFSKHLGKYYKTVSGISLAIPLIASFSLGVYRSTRSFNDLEDPYKGRIYSIAVMAPTFLGLAGLMSFVYFIISEDLKANGSLPIIFMTFMFLFLLLSVLGYLSVSTYDTFLNTDDTDFAISFTGLILLVVYASILLTIILKYLINRFHPLKSKPEPETKKEELYYNFD